MLMTPPDELDEKVEAEPPRMASTDDTFVSARRNAQENVGIVEGDVAEFEHRQAVFLQLQERGAARRDRKAADRDIGIAVAARAFRSDAGDVAENLDGRSRPRATAVTMISLPAVVSSPAWSFVDAPSGAACACACAGTSRAKGMTDSSRL
jgi:hypothetical protein